MNALARIPLSPIPWITSIEEVPRSGERAVALYEAACAALAAVVAVDEAKDIADQADAMRVYARQAKNRQLELDAAEIRIRAERKVGELISAQKEVVGLHQGGRPKTRQEDGQVSDEPKSVRVTLTEAGIDRNLSSRAQRLASLPQSKFEADVKDWREQAEREAGRVTVNLVRGGDKKTKRAVKEEILGRQIQALPDARFGVILADPEWRFEPYSRDTGLDRAADNHYPTSPLDVIKARPVGDIAARDCVLFLWATGPMLPQALDVMAAWGFEYRSHVVWRKAETRPGATAAPGRVDRGAASGALVLGTGYWFRSAHELLLVGVRGHPPAPAPGTQFPSVVDAAPRRHSEKPERFLELIETYFPHLPKIELNRRGAARPGWSAWGNEAEATEDGGQNG